MQKERILLLDPFYGGSHKQLTDLLYEKIPGCVKITMTPKKWHWRARMAALHFSRTIPVSEDYEILFSTSVLNLAELVALRPDLAKLQKILYFHENQLAYPKQEEKPRDVQYGYNQILSCLVADKVVFNSAYNMESFLSNIDKFFKIMPDYRPKGVAELIRPKCQVLYFPLNIQTVYQHARSGKSVRNVRSCDTPHYDCVSSETEKDSRCKIKFQSQTTILVSPKADISATRNTQGTEEEKSLFSNTCCENLLSEKELDRNCQVHLQTVESVSPSVCDISANSNSQVSHDLEAKNVISCTGGVNTEFKSVKSQQENANIEDLKSQTVQVSKNELPQNNYHYTVDESLTDKPEKIECKRQKLSNTNNNPQKPLHLVWAHRWEYDKDPDTLFDVLFRLFDAGISFTLSVMGEQYKDVPSVFEVAKHKLSPVIKAWGYQDNKVDYYNILADADVVISTAKHEFFGVAMLEAVYFGCYPLCPNSLVYPEIFPKTYLYNTSAQLYKKLRGFCLHPNLVRSHQCQVTIDKYLWGNCHNQFTELFLSRS